jgi:LacI family transcriptional regulator
MPTTPPPKYLEISREIEARILDGRQRGAKIPSAREIASLHKVSVVTASRALQVLRDKGLIEIVGRSGSILARTTAEPEAQTRKFGILLRSTPGPWRVASMSVPLRGFTTVARELGIGLDTEILEIPDPTTTAQIRTVVQKAVEAGLAGVFFMPTRHADASTLEDEALLEACRLSGLPVVLVERNLRGRFRPLAHDLVATDDLDGGYRSARHLLDQGRKRVAFVTGSPTSSHEGRIAGYLAALAEVEAEPIVLEQPSARPSREAFRDLVDRLLKRKVDGVICYQDYTAVGLIMEFLTRSVRIPLDVAITGFDNLPIGDSFALGVTTYEFPAESIARRAFQMMHARLSDRDAPPAKLLVPGRLILRESSAGGTVARNGHHAQA